MLIFSSSAERRAEAQSFAAAHDFDCLPDAVPTEAIETLASTAHSLALEFSDSAVQLRSLSEPRLKPLCVDFISGKAGFRQQKIRSAGGSAQEQVIKAMSLHRNSGAGLTVVDATAGLGRDAHIIASQVGQVWLFERHPVVARLLQDGLERARHSAASAVQLEVINRMQLCDIDFSLWTPPQDVQVDIVYLDPMFAAAAKVEASGRTSRKLSPLVKKDMQLLHELHAVELADTDERHSNERRILDKAFALKPARVVVKRARLAPFLAGEQTDLQLEGKAGRFDIYALRSLKKPSAR
ncbi:MAG: 16S rRNA methyltransferase [unclassified Hahellaceae]|nr:16S rRNA methyltransferase [Hahellaceae bacterium]